MKKIFLMLAGIFIIPAILCAAPTTFDDSNVGISNVQTTGGDNTQVMDPLSLPNFDDSPASMTFLPPNHDIPSKTLDQVFNELNNNEKAVPARVRYIPENNVAWYTRWKMISDAQETIDCT
ncbi:MAG: hypothetical protein HQM08_22990 [Candidatus Riflebacteria bacterium]|nr:hypothetical protein [Candidatus Riflebacteria bacterium]